MIFVILKDPLTSLIDEDDTVIPDMYLLFCTSCMLISAVENVYKDRVKGCSCTSCGALTLTTDNPKLFIVANPDEDNLQKLADHKEVESIPGKDTMIMLSRIKYVEELLKFANQLDFDSGRARL